MPRWSGTALLERLSRLPSFMGAASSRDPAERRSRIRYVREMARWGEVVLARSTRALRSLLGGGRT